MTEQLSHHTSSWNVSPVYGAENVLKYIPVSLNQTSTRPEMRKFTSVSYKSGRSEFLISSTTSI